MKIVAHVDKCIAAGHCAKVAPQLFGQDEDTGLVVLLKEVPAADERALAERAARLCPALAIELNADEDEAHSSSHASQQPGATR
jgi:ferredoxin